MRQFQIIVLTFPGLPDASIAISASRAGGLGILDLEFTRDSLLAQQSIAKLARYTKNDFGLRLNSHNEQFIAEVTTHLPQHMRVVILTGSDTQTLARQVESFHHQKRTVFLEATDLALANLGEELGVDGIIAKGNESRGRVGEETTFILVQRLLSHVTLPVFAQGGVGPHSSAALYAAGVAGVVLDSQIALTRESPLPESIKARLAAMDGSETITLGDSLGESYRVYCVPDLAPVGELNELQQQLAADQRPRDEVNVTWRAAIERWVGWTALEKNLLLVGQDAAFAASLARQFTNVAGVLDGIRKVVDAHAQTARQLRPLAEGAPLAQSHTTRYPIVQGAMTRVSDRADFAFAVAEGGALPFLALALLRGPEVETLLAETRRRLEHRSWGVGILGFIPLELRQEQLAVIRAYRPPFVLIAGGRPDQAKALEKEGIATYLHVPSPGLLRNFLQEGTRRFIFEGRECGGHVGPRCSLVLWEQMIEVFLEFLEDKSDVAKECHVVFAGGIHDALSASMVSVMAAPLAERGVRIGVLMGTAYMFTEEAVTTGAIIPEFQRQALQCEETTLLETGPGHSTRCINSTYVNTFKQEKLRLIREGRTLEEIRNHLELMNIGRLRIASKGVTRASEYNEDSNLSKFVSLREEEQEAHGMYMIGQVASLRHQTCTIAELHHDIAVEGTRRLERIELLHQPPALIEEDQEPSDVAIIGMACLLPKASNIRTYWDNICNKVDAITEIPKDRWDWELYYDPDRQAQDKVYSKWGGFLDDLPFNPFRYGMPPSSLPSIEPLQLLTLETVREALQDAGYLDRPFPRERTSVILGTGGGGGDQGTAYGVRGLMPHYLHRAGDLPLEPQEVMSHLEKVLPEWTEDSFPGILGNVAAGRVANRFDLGGRNFAVDAACAASLAAVDLAVRELETGSSDMVIVGGADTMQSPFAYLCFSKTQALSPRGHCFTFDESADGITISEGVGILILKRLDDAERDGDRIYAVIKGVGGSSDGKDKGLTAPHPSGQVRALKRAYAKAGISPATVDLIEAHGTGTVAGDQAEIEALTTVFTEAGAELQSCAIGSVKSMIGHTKCTAGVASIIKVALALHHKVLPPTLNVQRPNPRAKFPETPFYVNTELQAWVGREEDFPRRAGVSAFGFGGTNFHAVLEEYTGNHLTLPSTDHLQWPSELFVWEGNSRQELLHAVESFEKSLPSQVKPRLQDLAYTLHRLKNQDGDNPLHLAVVATSVEDLRQKLARAKEALARPENVHIIDPTGVYFTEKPMAREGKVAFLFPGQGSQYPGMLKDLVLYFPEVRAEFEKANQVLESRLSRSLSSYVYPPVAFSEEDEYAARESLTETHIAQPALGVTEIALFHLLGTLGVRPDFVAGHSYGEYVALCAADVFNEEDLIILSEARGRFILEAAGEDSGAMVVVEAGADQVSEAIAAIDGVVVANCNTPKQTVISGTTSGVEAALAWFNAQSVRARRIPVACAFHSPVVSRAREPLAEMLAAVNLGTPHFEVFSNTTGKPYPREAKDILNQLTEHLALPVDFVREIQAMYEAGARVFVEVGPGTVLTGLVGQILEEETCFKVASDQPGRSSLLQLQHLLAQLVTQGTSVNLDQVYRGREVKSLNLGNFLEESKEDSLLSATWMVNGARVKPAREMARTEPTPRPKQTNEARPSIIRRRFQAPATPFETRSNNSQKGDGTLRVDSTQVEQQVQPPAVSKSLMPVQTMVKPLDVPLSPHAQSATGLPTSLLSQGDVNEVMVRYQQVMSHFLDSQKMVMLTYLQEMAKPGASPTAHATALAQWQGISPRQSHTPESPYEPETQLAIQSQSTSQHLRELGPSSVESQEKGQLVEPNANGQPGKQGSGIPDIEQVTSNLLGLVSERTGYPLEMLDLDMNLESDLGIDSIKRVEILGSFQRSYSLGEEGSIGEEIEELIKIKTLRGIINWIVDYSVSEEPTQAEQPRLELSKDKPGPSEVELEPTVVEVEAIKRFTLTAIERPLPTEPQGLAEGHVLVLTDDEKGVAEALAENLLQRGYSVVRVRNGQRVEALEERLYTTDFTSPTSVGELCNLLRQQHGAIGGLVHLLPLNSGLALSGQMDPQTWSVNLRTGVKSLLYLAKALKTDLQEAANAGGACVLGATAMGGVFGSAPDDEAQYFFPGHGGVAGFLKTLAQEWPDVGVKVVDLDPRVSVTDLAGYLHAELATKDGQVEVGYQGSRRFVLQPKVSPILSDGPKIVMLDSSSVVLVTGGARGITAAVTRELAERYRPTLLLVGRSPRPDEQEFAETVGLSSPRELKAAIMEQMRQQGQSVTHSQVDAIYTRLLRDREIRENLEALQSTGARVEYFAVDVRDEEAFGQLIDNIYVLYGRLDGVIHGAGIIEDKLIEDKTPESFDLVFDTKVEGAYLLSRKLRLNELSFLVFFSSISGRLGNRGQCDYAAANEVLNKLAIHLKGQCPGRIVSVNWGPWESGMVSPELQRQFAQRGLTPIPMHLGAKTLVEELLYGRESEVEVLIGGGPWDTLSRVSMSSGTLDLPLLTNEAFPAKRPGAPIEVVHRLDLSRDLYLHDHKLDSRPVLPMAVAQELMAEVAARSWPELQVIGVKDLRVFQGIIVESDTQEIRVVAQPQSPDSGERLDVAVTLFGTAAPEQPCYCATVELAREHRSPALSNEFLPLPSGSRFPMSIEEAYEQWLFHGSLLQGIAEIHEIGSDGVTASLLPSSPSQWVAGSSGSSWLIDPGVIDSGLQLILLWARLHWDKTVLPSGFRAYSRYGPLSGKRIDCRASIRVEPGEIILHADLFFFDADGRFLGLMEDVEAIASKALNRLANRNLPGVQQ